MFNPSRDEVRGFFCDVWQRDCDGELLTPLQAIAARWAREHPEYQPLLNDAEQAKAEDYSVERGTTNPFLHLAMHLAIDEQVSIDQPPGIRAALARLERGAKNLHEAHHAAMECLGDVMWQAQRGTLPPDMAIINEAYLACLNTRFR